MLITQDYAILILRAVIAAVFLVHGTNKLKGWSKSPAFFRFLGIAETAGGIGMLTGVLSQYAALGFSIIMVGAIYSKIAKWHVPFSGENTSGWEFDLTLLAASLILAAAGPGAYALGRILGLPL